MNNTTMVNIWIDTYNDDVYNNSVKYDITLDNAIDIMLASPNEEWLVEFEDGSSKLVDSIHNDKEEIENWLIGEKITEKICTISVENFIKLFTIEEVDKLIEWMDDRFNTTDDLDSVDIYDFTVEYNMNRIQKLFGMFDVK